MYGIILLFHVLIALVLIGLVLMQQGKGAEAGAAFGGGASQTVFGSQGSTSFLMKVTGGLAAAFFVTSLLLGHMASTAVKRNTPQSLAQKVIQQVPGAELPVGPVQAAAAPSAPKSIQRSQSTHKKLTHKKPVLKTQQTARQVAKSSQSQRKHPSSIAQVAHKSAAAQHTS